MELHFCTSHKINQIENRTFQHAFNYPDKWGIFYISPTHIIIPFVRLKAELLLPQSIISSIKLSILWTFDERINGYRILKCRQMQSCTPLRVGEGVGILSLHSFDFSSLCLQHHKRRIIRLNQLTPIQASRYECASEFNFTLHNGHHAWRVECER